MIPKRPLNRYGRIIQRIFELHHQPGKEEVTFDREEIIDIARELGIKLPKNIGDVIYSFRYRSPLPAAIIALAGEGKHWIIRPAGRARYRLVAVAETNIAPHPALVETRVPDATPGVIAMYALGDEQALLAKLRYNRLIDMFTGVVCYSLQSHLRTTVPGMGQIEADEIYVGIDRRGAHYVFPVEAKSARENLGIVQVEQLFALCEARFGGLLCRPIGAQSMEDDLIALFEFEKTGQGVRVSAEKHYRLVPPDDLSPAELAAYARRTD